LSLIAVTTLLIGLGTGVYSYLLYPLLLKALGVLRTRPVRAEDPVQWPMVSITVPAFNEERAIGPTLDCILATDYPPDRRQVVVVSDCSTDRTDEIVRGYADRGVELLRMAIRGGKTAAENAARDRLRGDIVVNTDASVRLHPGALKPLVRCFGDPEVGVASGRDVSVARGQADVNVGESRYVGYEMWVRALETRIGSIVGASGCLYAIRAELHRNLVPEALSRDFAAALIAREHGYRAVSVDESICFVPRIGSLHQEFRRKVRTMTRGLETLYYKRALLNPLRHGLFSWMLASHKLIRWLTPLGTVAALLGLTLLAFSSRAAAVVGMVAAVVLVLAAVGWLWPEGRRAPRVVSVPAYVVSGLVAALVAWRNALRGELNPVWEPTRRAAAGA
jgi:cellulose synthase/poly-beta-1,6-N-acetylglucosamine synthase-like glycosyltransferase